MAKYLGITRTGYNKYESGDIKPVRKLNELADLFDVSTDYLLGREESSLEAKIRLALPKVTNQLEKYLNLRNEAKSVVDIMIDAVYDKENSVYRRQK